LPNRLNAARLIANKMASAGVVCIDCRFASGQPLPFRVDYLRGRGTAQNLRAGEVQSPDPNSEYITDRFARLNLGQFPLAGAPCADVLDRALLVQPLDG